MSILKPVSILAALVFVLSSPAVFSQTPDKNTAQTDTGFIRSSPAYAEILLRKTELLADLDAYSADYTDANPKIVDLRVELGSLDKLLERVFAVKPADAGKLTQALGKLIVRKAALETELSRLTLSYNKDHPDVKRMKRKVDIYDAAIKEILR